jgi:hypothetical protein
MAAEDCSKVALEAGLKSKVYVKDQETDVSLLFVPYIMVELKLQKLLMLLQCLTTDVVLLKT